MYTKCYSDGNTYNSNSVLSESSSNNQWTKPYEDDDEDDHWCVMANTPTTWSPFQCSFIKCVMERKLDTGDKSYDWAFQTVQDPSKDYLDNMIILNGRAQLWIRSADYAISLSAPHEYVSEGTGAGETSWQKTYITIPIYAQAFETLLGASLAALGLFLI